MPEIHHKKITRICCELRVAGIRGITLKNRGKKTTMKFNNRCQILFPQVFLFFNSDGIGIRKIDNNIICGY
jgi:hypothetical protein